MSDVKAYYSFSYAVQRLGHTSPALRPVRALLVRVSLGPRPWLTKVPYKTLPSETEWNLCFGLFHSNRDDEGFMVPDFSWVQVQKLPEPRVSPYR